MRATHVLETCLYTDDLDAAQAFYQTVLGLQLWSKGEGRHVFFRLESAMFLLFNPAQTSRTGEGMLPHGAMGAGHAAFRVREEEIGPWRDHLLRHNVEIEKEVTWPSGGHSLYFRDPAGNCLELATPALWRLTEDKR
jgi:catechol 2,3-dioxygenase-like lactoylglutathione lyase family enzyme